MSRLQVDFRAAKARDHKAIELYGEYAWRNIPPESEPGDGQ